MIEIEELAQSEVAHDIRVNAATAEAPQPPEKLDLMQVERDLFNFFNEISGKIPDWVPVVPSYLKAKKAQWTAMAALHNNNLETGEKFANKSEALKVFLEKTLSGLWQEGRAAIDLLLIFGTGGSGNVVLGVEKTAAEQAGKITLESLGKQIAKIAAGGETAVVDMLPGLFEGLATKLAHHPEEAKHLLELARVFEKLIKIPGAKPLVEQLLASQEWWQKLKSEFQSSQGRVANGQRILKSVKKSGYTAQPTPA